MLVGQGVDQLRADSLREQLVSLGGGVQAVVQVVLVAGADQRSPVDERQAGVGLRIAKPADRAIVTSAASHSVGTTSRRETGSSTLPPPWKHGPEKTIGTRTDTS